MTTMGNNKWVAQAKSLKLSAQSGAIKWRDRALDMLFPPCCLACDAPIVAADGLCAPCWGKLRFISKPYCPVLGIPFAADLGAGVLSAEAIAQPPTFARARAAVIYDDLARQLVSQFKYGDRLELAKFCAQLMYIAGEDFWASSCVFVPVPLHWRRRLSRRYNQSQLLADQLGQLTGFEVRSDWVERKRFTRQQVGLSSKDREQNVRGAFVVTDRFLEQYQGQHIVIVDDVVTTGATVEAIARSFKAKYRDKVNVLSFARVVTGPIGAI
ncbi:ComF family protein [uncultured Maritalea sp.]|jgi:ComF family protein|uniref:ComF family protein n=1 Tax=uncultured Maritalea sp. TaxID=757249 RepID=UPI00260AC24E|nr:ComF family protein [uncultured Maritalea sp.]